MSLLLRTPGDFGDFSFIHPLNVIKIVFRDKEEYCLCNVMFWLYKTLAFKAFFQYIIYVMFPKKETQLEPTFISFE